MNSSSKDITLIKEKLEALTKLYETNLKDFDEKETKMAELEARTEEILKMQKKEHIVTINVGGVLFKTTTDTLLSFENSLFQQINLKDGLDGAFFDRSPVLFEYILNYLRTKRLNLKKLIMEELYDDFLEELKYYSISELPHAEMPTSGPVEFIRMTVSSFYAGSSTDVSCLQKQDLSSHVLTNSPGWIIVEFDHLTEFGQMQIGGVSNNTAWSNYQEGWGSGADVLTSVDGESWTSVGAVPSGWGQSITDFSVKRSIAKFLKLNHNSWIGIGYLNINPL